MINWINSPADLHHLFANAIKYVMHHASHIEIGICIAVCHSNKLFKTRHDKYTYTLDERANKNKWKEMNTNLIRLNMKCICDLDITNTYHIRAPVRKHMVYNEFVFVCFANAFADVLRASAATVPHTPIHNTHTQEKKRHDKNGSRSLTFVSLSHSFIHSYIYVCTSRRKHTI